MLKDIVLGMGLAVMVFLIIIGFNIIPVMLFGVFLILMIILIKKSGMMDTTFGKIITKNNGTCFEYIGGQSSAKKELIEALDFIVKQDKVKKMGIRPLKGILLTGPPGTGKTLLAKAAASYTDSVFISASGSEFIEMYAGVGAQRVRNLFNKANNLAKKEKKNRAIIFIDEIEILGGKRGSHSSHLEYDQTLNQLLVEMDGLDSDNSNTKILIIGATNRQDMIDDALLRPGRFDRIVNVELPDKKGRLEILKIHLGNKPLDKNLNLEEIAGSTYGYSGAHLENVANEAAILAFRQNEEIIRQEHFIEAIDKVMLGEKLDKKPDKNEKKRIAVHETGHAIISEKVRPGSVSHITIRPRGNAMGYIRQNSENDMYLYTKEYITGQIKICIAGSAAEKIILGNKSTGAINDFQKAVELAKKIIYSGLSDLGVVCKDTIPTNDLQKEINKIISDSEKKVEKILKYNLLSLKKVSEKLIQEENISGNELRILIKTNDCV
jgi:ATP-dependent metalloprotease FtsH